MQDHERVRLLHGPYAARALRRGDRAACLYRDCEVIVTAWTDAPLSWPCCLVSHNRRGGGAGCWSMGS